MLVLGRNGSASMCNQQEDLHLHILDNQRANVPLFNLLEPVWFAHNCFCLMPNHKDSMATDTEPLSIQFNSPQMVSRCSCTAMGTRYRLLLNRVNAPGRHPMVNHSFNVINPAECSYVELGVQSSVNFDVENGW